MNYYYSALILLFFTVSEYTYSKPDTINLEQKDRGSLTIICGAMCSGKSEEIIRRVGRYKLAGKKVIVLKKDTDNRRLLDKEESPLTYISSRNGGSAPCKAIASSNEIVKEIENSHASVIVIDEAQFFTPDKDEFIAQINQLVAMGKKIIIAGLEVDFRGKPFGPMPELLALADNVVKLTAICKVCGEETFCISQRLIDGKPAHYNDPLIVVGDSQYEPRCRNCHIIRKD